VWFRLLTIDFAGVCIDDGDARELFRGEISHLLGVGVTRIPYLDHGGLFDTTYGGIGGFGVRTKHGLALFGRRVRVCVELRHVELRHVRRSVQEVVSLEDDVKLRTTTQWLMI
jgi:hypothetical protein